MRIEPENNSVSIVLVGSLNAAIFHPAWFAANNLLSKNDLESSEVDVILRKFAAFRVADWLRINVEPNRFLAETTEPPFFPKLSRGQGDRRWQIWRQFPSDLHDGAVCN
jgi:hypothetical protein